MDAQFYYLNDLKVVGKMQDFVPYLYDRERGWQVDNDNLLMDRLVGYDGETIGGTMALLQIEEISAERAEQHIAKN